MLILTNTRSRLALPLNTITKARAAVEGGWTVTDAQGKDHAVDDISWEMAVEGTPTAMIPALPGTYLVTASEGEDGAPPYWRDNVLGWMICADTEVRPVVISGEALLTKPWRVMHPDGRVESSNGESWDTTDAWLESEKPERVAAE